MKTSPPLRVRLRRATLRVLDFDIENRPLAYLGMDFTSAEITAIAAGWSDKPDIQAWLLGVDKPVDMLQAFRSLYDQADIVTGHYILKHDLPIINGAMLEYGLLPLGPKYVSDTKVHLTRRKYISASQESLAGMFGLPAPKHHMSNPEWRAANRLTPEGIEGTRTRVVADVVQHKELRARLLELGALRNPTLWKP